MSSIASVRSHADEAWNMIGGVGRVMSSPLSALQASRYIPRRFTALICLVEFFRYILISFT